MKRNILTIIVVMIAMVLSVGTKAENHTNVFNILDLGGKNDGSTDISSIINENTEKGAIFLPAGLYRVDAPLRLKNPLKGEGYSRTTHTRSSATWLLSNIQCQDGEQGVIEYGEYSCINIENLNIKCNSKEDGIRVKPCSQKTMTLINHVGIFALEGCGIRIEGTGSRPAFLEDITIFGKGNHPMGCTGMIIEPADCRLSNIEIMGIQIGLDIRGGYTYGNNMHLWTGYMGKKDDGEWWKGTRGIVLSKGGIFCGSQIYPDTSYYLFEQKKDNNGGFDISEFIYYDDACERDSKDLNGALFHYEKGATPNLRIHGGIIAVCGSDEHPLGMTKMYTPGQDIDNVLVRTDRSICGKNINVLCLGDALPDYTVEYAEKGWCKIGDIFNIVQQGAVKANISTDDGAMWLMNVTKVGCKLTVKFKAENTLCKKYKLKYGMENDLIKIYMLTPDTDQRKIRFTAEAMTPYFRPVDYGSLRHHNFAPCYKEVKANL